MTVSYLFYPDSDLGHDCFDALGWASEKASGVQTLPL